MLEKLLQSKNSNFIIDLNDTKNYNCWILKEKNKDHNSNPHIPESKNIISYSAVGLYLQKMEKKQNNSTSANSKYYEFRFNNLISDIFPFERNPEINFMYYNSQNENLFGSNFYENKKSNYEQKKMDELRKKMINDDIPEMILYKYKYDKNLFDELMEYWEDEPNFIFNLLKGNRKYKYLDEKDAINCIKTLIQRHKIELYDITHIIKEFQSDYKNIFKEEDVLIILSLYDALYIKFKLKQIKIQKLHNQLILTTNLTHKIDFTYTNESKNEFDLDLALAHIGYSISILNFNSNKKFCDNLLDLNINLNSKKLLQSTLEDGCDKIISKFCLSPEDVANNLKIMKKEIKGNIKEPNKDCQIMDVCSHKTVELLSKKKKRYHPIHLLQRAINYYIISLSSHPYIAKLIYKHYLNAAKISTQPTEKGKVLLNYSNPSFRVKNIKKQDLTWFIDNMKNNEDDYSEAYLDIEKCEKEGLIKCDIEIDSESKHIKDLIKLLNIAVNGRDDYIFENLEKSQDNRSDSDESEFNKVRDEVKKNTLVRKIAIKNMILDKEFTQKYFINNIKKECHNIAEKYLIEKISNHFYDKILTRRHIPAKLNENNDIEAFYYSIFFINYNTFCYIAIDKNKKIKYKNILKTNILLNDKNELKNEMYAHIPKCIILGINNIGAYKLINYFEINDCIIFSDYLSLLKIPKQYDINSTNEKEYFYSIAYDQYKYTMNPLEFFIENYNFKYEKNLLLNLKLHYLQEQINDIPLLNYCLEMQIRRILNLYKFRYENGKNPINNYYCFMNGLGPLTSKLIDDYKNKSLTELKNATGEKILNNIFNLIHGNNMLIEDDKNFIYHFQEEEIFNKMINSFQPIKNNSIHNVFVNDIDEEKKNINCVLFYNDNILKCVLPFINVDSYINDIKAYFKKYRILLCKIVNLQIDRNENRIVLSNKISNLEYLENYSDDQECYIDNSDMKEINRLPSIQHLKNIINSQKGVSEKYLQKINEDNTYTKNIFLAELKNDYISINESGKYVFRPSYLGPNNLILTLSFCENLTLNYNIVIEKEENKYILNDMEYTSINDIINKFANPMLIVINEFKKNKYFKSPSQMKPIFNKIFFNINETNSNNNANKINIFDPINICFVEDSPNYGMLITKNKNNCINLDFIELTLKGFYFHNKLFDNISLIIEYYLENNNKEWYKEFICENIISDAHSKLEYIDLQYKEFTDQVLKKLNWSLEPNNNNSEQEKNNTNNYLGKKRELGFDGWGNNENNEDAEKNKEDNNFGSFWSSDNNNKEQKNDINDLGWNSNDNGNNENNDMWDSNNNNNQNSKGSNNENINNNNWTTNNNANNNYSGRNNQNNSWNNNYNGYNNKKSFDNNERNNINNYSDNNRNKYNNNGYNNNRQNNNGYNNNGANNNGHNNKGYNNKRYNNNYKFKNNFENKNVSKFSWANNNQEENNDNNDNMNESNSFNKNDLWTNNQQQDSDIWGKEDNNYNNNFNNNSFNNNFNDNNFNNNSSNNNSYNNNSFNNNSFNNNSSNNNSYNNNNFSNRNFSNSFNNNSKNKNYSNNNNNNNWNNNSKNKNNNSFNNKNYYRNKPSIFSWGDNNNNNNNNYNNKNNYNKNNNNNNDNDNRIYNCSNDNYYDKTSFNKNANNNNNSSHCNNNFNPRNNNYKKNKNKKKGNWAKEMENDKNIEDIKDDDEQGPIDFENVDAFGGYNVDKEDNNNDNKAKNDEEREEGEMW